MNIFITLVLVSAFLAYLLTKQKNIEKCRAKIKYGEKLKEQAFKLLNDIKLQRGGTYDVQSFCDDYQENIRTSINPDECTTLQEAQQAVNSLEGLQLLLRRRLDFPENYFLLLNNGPDQDPAIQVDRN